MNRRKDGPRPAVVGTCCMAKRGVTDARTLLADGLTMADEMARQARERGWKLDLALLPEAFAHADESASSDAAEPLDGRIVTALAAKARELGIYVAVPLYLREGSRTRNSVVLIGRDGTTVGVYHKARPVVLPDGTLEGGVTPGCEAPVFDLEFGRVGVQICFDACYDEGWNALASQGAELVLFPSASPCVSALVSHAYRGGYYIAGAISRPPAVVVDPVGREIARAAGDREATVVRVDLDYRILPSRFTWTRGKEIKDKYGERVDFGWHDAEGFCILTSRDPSLSVGRLIEMETLETLRDFCERNRAAQSAAISEA
jgi:predicted amidohydrolase